MLICRKNDDVSGLTDRIVDGIVNSESYAGCKDH